MIRTARESDLQAVIEINRRSEPAVGPMDRAKAEFFFQHAPYFVVLEQQSAVAGYLIGLTEQSDRYKSPNYLWFKARHERFAYIDRIALSPRLRRAGHGRSLYEALFRWAAENNKPVTCAEVNTIPDNPPSHAFHGACGFARVALTRPYAEGAAVTEVAMYERRL